MIDDNIRFELWKKRTLLRGERWFWHCKSVRDENGGNGEIVFSGQAAGYSSNQAAMSSINIARGTSFETPVDLIFI